MNRYAIEQTRTDGEQTLYWVGPSLCWNAQLPEGSTLLSGPQADRELARLRERLPHAANRLAIVDVLTRRARAAVFGPAFRAAIAGQERTPAAIEAAHAAGRAALQRAGYSV